VPVNKGRASLLGGLVVAILAVAWWAWPEVTAPVAAPVLVEPAPLPDPVPTVVRREVPPPERPPAAPRPTPAPWAKPTVASDTAMVTHEELAPYLAAYAVKGRVHELATLRATRAITYEEQVAHKKLIREAAMAPVTVNVRHLQQAVSGYRTALLIIGSAHTEALHHEELILLAMASDGPAPAERLRERACALTEAPKDCSPGQFPTCGPWDHLQTVATALCADPLATMSAHRGTDSDFGRR